MKVECFIILSNQGQGHHNVFQPTCKLLTGYFPAIYNKIKNDLKYVVKKD